MKKILVFLILMFLPCFIFAKSFEADWKRGFGGSDSDNANELLVIDDYIYTVVSSKSTDIEGVNNNGSFDVYIVKYDKDGNVLKKINYGGSESDLFKYAFVNSNKEIVMIVGTSSTDIDGIEFGAVSDSIIVKFDKDLNVLWNHNIGGNNHDTFRYVDELSDGSLIVVGNTKSNNISGFSFQGVADSIIYKYDKDGNLLWKQSFGGNRWDQIDRVIVDKDDNFYITSMLESSSLGDLVNKGGYDQIIAKYDKDGNLLWRNIYGGSGSEESADLMLNENNELIVVFYTRSTDISGLETKGGIDVVMLKYSSDGNLMWQRQFGGTDYDVFGGIKFLEDGSFLFIGYEPTQRNGESVSVGWLKKYDNDGNIIWEKEIENNYYVLEYEYNVDTGYIMYGSSPNPNETNITKKNFVIRFYDKDFKLISEKSYDIFSIINIFGVQLDNSFYLFSQFLDSGDVEGVTYNGVIDSVLVKYSLVYDINISDSIENGSVTCERKGNIGVITSTPNDGYIVDKIIVKDITGKDIDVSLLDDGKYGFILNDDVNVDVKFIRTFNINKKEIINGDAEIIKNGNIVSIKPLADKGYEFDKIIIKNSKNEEVKVNKLEDGTYSFELSDDVSVEVLFKEEIVNPKTGIINFITIIFVGFVVSFIGFIFVRNNCYRYEL